MLIKNNLGSFSEISIRPGIFDILVNIFESYKVIKKSNKVLFIVDENLYSRQKEKIDTLVHHASNYDIEIVRAGESIKSLDGIELLYRMYLKHKICRDSTIVAIAGGTICDAVGFACSTYMRSIPMVNIPTTLMSVVDPVWGKVGVNYASRKNLLGSFFFPILTVIDTNMINRENLRYYRTGISEIIKSAFIRSKHDVLVLQERMSQLLAGNQETLMYSIKLGIGVKIQCVAHDFDDTKGNHAKLSLGHELADVLEGKFLFGRITHGEAVALGMLFSFKTNALLQKSRSTVKLYDRLLSLIEAAGLPTELPVEVDEEEIWWELKNNRKSFNNEIILVLVEDYGVVRRRAILDKSIIFEAIGALRTNHRL